MSKYNNTKSWLDPVRVYDHEFAEAVEYIHYAICYADDIADRAIRPENASSVFWNTFTGMSYFVKNPKYWDRMHKVLNDIYKSAPPKPLSL